MFIVNIVKEEVVKILGKKAKNKFKTLAKNVKVYSQYVPVALPLTVQNVFNISLIVFIFFRFYIVTIIIGLIT